MTSSAQGVDAPHAGYELLRTVTGGPLRPGGLQLTQRALDLCDFAPKARILDLGCGPGATLAYLKQAGFATFGLDHSAAMLAESKHLGPCVRAVLAPIPLRDACMDGIICECVLSQAEDKDAVLAECLRVLRPGGRLVLSDLVRLGGPCAEPDAAPTGSASTGRNVPGSVAFGSVTARPVTVGSGPPCSAGALLPECLAALLRASGFTIMHQEDHSQLLRDLAARIVWEYGSREAFTALWQNGADTSACGAEKGVKFGYLLFAAQKQEE